MAKKQIEFADPIPIYKRGKGLGIIAINYDNALPFAVYRIEAIVPDPRNAKIKLFMYPVDVTDDGVLLNSESEATRNTQVYESVLEGCLDIFGQGSWSPSYPMANIIPPNPTRLKLGILGDPEFGNALVNRVVKRNTLRTMLLLQQQQYINLITEFKRIDTTSMLNKYTETVQHFQKNLQSQGDGERNIPAPKQQI